jgi:outer membrane receptor protein involved in Fe transport
MNKEKFMESKKLYSLFLEPKINSLKFVSLLLFFVFSMSVQIFAAQQEANSPELESYFNLLKEEKTTLITTGASRPLPKEKMPASVIVITADEIKLLGLRNLTDVINYLVPGGVGDLHRADKTGLYCFRGITADDNAKYVFMVDGLNSNSLTSKGGSSEVYLGLLDELDRIEITEGPSSSLYGDGATSGVINFITKTGRDFQGTEVTAGFGSGHKYETSVKYGKKRSETDSDFYYFGFRRSDGFNPEGGSGSVTNSKYWEEHAASGRHWDHFAPSGKFHSNIERGDFTLRTRYVREIFEEPYVWSQKASGATTQFEERADRFVGHEYMFIQPEIKHRFNDNHSIKTNLSFEIDDRWEERFKDWYGSAGGDKIADAGHKILAYGERKFRGQFFHYYDGWANHKFTSGAEFLWMCIGPDLNGDNFHITSSSGHRRVQASKTRETVYSGAIFFEDIWQVSPQDTFFGGLRVENHKLAPSSISPRAAISHDFDEKTNLKFLYNSGYRIPLWTDYTQNITGGYPEPKPEKVQSFETHLLHSFSPKFSTTLIGYYTIYKDLLYYWSGHGKYNFSNVKAAGLELVGDYRTKNLKLRLSHSYSRPVSLSDNNYTITQLSYDEQHWGEFPTHMTKGYAIINLIEDRCLLGITYFRPWAIRGQRDVDSKLKHPADYINATLTFKLNKNLDLQLSGYNLTGEDRPWWGANTADGLSRDIDPHTSYFVRLIGKF